MSPDSIITIESLGKKYSLRHQLGERYTALRDVLADRAKNLFVRSGKNGKDPAREEFWALKNVSFDVKRGEVVGIIGRNGAGKSTLLKILSRITSPSEGRVRLNGRVASLLEVGTGFHPELTGRENIFLNGAILGMSKAEIKRKFEEIVNFAEIEKFLDTPVKRYSSGMYVRLAFAVAAHLEPEILVVDEVLAVGDAEFQKKCLGKMQSVSRREGRTVLFVSHNLPAVLDLCTKGLLLDRGKPVLFGPVEQACTAYLNLCRNQSTAERKSGILRSISLIDENGARIGAFGGEGLLRFRCALRPPEEGCLLSLILRDANTYALVELLDHSFSPSVNGDSDTLVEIHAGPIPLRPGQYSVDFWCGNRSAMRLEYLDRVLEFDVVSAENTGPNTKIYGPLRFPSRWQVISPEMNTMQYAG
jgi:lipopolysaccharide transport system ATP-binding protein